MWSGAAVQADGAYQGDPARGCSDPSYACSTEERFFAEPGIMLCSMMESTSMSVRMKAVEEEIEGQSTQKTKEENSPRDQGAQDSHS